MVLQGLWVLRVRQHIKVAVWIHTGHLRWYITQCNLAVMSHRVIVFTWRGVGWRKKNWKEQERREERGCTWVQKHHIAAKHGGARGLNDDRCNSQSNAELRLCTRLADDALHFFISLCRQRDAVPLQHLHSCVVSKVQKHRFRDWRSVSKLDFTTGCKSISAYLHNWNQIQSEQCSFHSHIGKLIFSRHHFKYYEILMILTVPHYCRCTTLMHDTMDLHTISFIQQRKICQKSMQTVNVTKSKDIKLNLCWWRNSVVETETWINICLSFIINSAVFIIIPGSLNT